MVCILALNLTYNKNLHTIDLDTCSILIFRKGSGNSFLTNFVYEFSRKMLLKLHSTKKVRHNCSGHHSAHLFIIVASQ